MSIRTAVSLGAAALALAGGVAAAAPASAATYDGVNPNGSVCNNTAKTVKSASVKDLSGRVIGSIELRYSTGCRTVWVRTNGDQGKAADHAGMIGWVVRNSDGKKYSAEFQSGSTTGWSRMLNDSGVTSYASGSYDGSDGEGPTVRTGNY